MDQFNKELVQEISKDSTLASWDLDTNDTNQWPLDLFQRDCGSGEFGTGKERQQWKYLIVPH
jgi:hypothetical protein